MPLMPRCDKKSTKIAFNILGVPCNIASKNYKKIKSYPVIKNSVRQDEYFRITGK